MVELVFITPFVTGLLAFVLPKALSRQLLVFTGAVHLVLSLLLWKTALRLFLPNILPCPRKDCCLFW